MSLGFDAVVAAVIANEVTALAGAQSVFGELVKDPVRRFEATAALLRRAPYTRLERDAYDFLVEIINSLLDGVNQGLDDEGHIVLAKVFYIGRTYGTLDTSAESALRTRFRTARDWHLSTMDREYRGAESDAGVKARMNSFEAGTTYMLKDMVFNPCLSRMDLWIKYTRGLIASDLEQFRDLRDAARRACPRDHEFDALLRLSDAEMHALFSVLRVQAIIATLHQLQTPCEILQEFYRSISTEMNLAEAGIELASALSPVFITWVIEAALVVGLKLGFSSQSSTDLQLLIRENAEGKLSDCAGFSPIRELIFYSAERLASSAPLAATLPKETKAQQSQLPAIGVPASKVACESPTVGASMDETVGSCVYCVCGGNIKKWQAMGIAPRHPLPDLRGYIPMLMCEHCYKLTYSNPLRSDVRVNIIGYAVIPQLYPSPPASFATMFAPPLDPAALSLAALKTPAATQRITPRAPRVSTLPPARSALSRIRASFHPKTFGYPDLPSGCWCSLTHIALCAQEQRAGDHEAA